MELLTSDVKGVEVLWKSSLAYTTSPLRLNNNSDASPDEIKLATPYSNPLNHLHDAPEWAELIVYATRITFEGG